MQETFGGSQSRGGYHCDLRLDNIFVSSGSGDILLFDFDHYGKLANFLALEVGCLEWMNSIANHALFAGSNRKSSCGCMISL
jgi:Ser/Thr protein kinase RdoA (MazF antagonist)